MENVETQVDFASADEPQYEPPECQEIGNAADLTQGAAFGPYEYGISYMYTSA